jgi:PIN domain nuclease of toxin-antitoxin system
VILLDTHIAVWLALDPKKLSKHAVSAIRNERGDRGGLAISGITLYEIALLAAKGRINLRTSPESFLNDMETHFTVKPITGGICSEAVRLPDAYPRDPVDRLIGATAIIEGMKLITADAAIRGSHAVDTVW